MSLILEALKKSEAERRLGQAPGLLSPAPPLRRRHGLWPLLLVLVLAVVLSTGITWWLLRPEPAASTADVARETGSRETTANSGAPAAIAAEPAPAAPAPVPDAPAPRTAAPASAAATATVRPPVERESAPVAADATLLQPPRPATTPATPEPPRPTPAATATPAATPTPTPAAGTEPAEPPPPAEPPVPPLRALPRDVQEALPPLKLSMHVFNEDPAQRFVLIDGRRYSEGMALADGLLLEAIRRDGVVLVFRGHRFHLPRPG